MLLYSKKSGGDKVNNTLYVLLYSCATNSSIFFLLIDHYSAYKTEYKNAPR